MESHSLEVIMKPSFRENVIINPKVIKNTDSVASKSIKTYCLEPLFETNDKFYSDLMSFNSHSYKTYYRIHRHQKHQNTPF